MTRIARLSGRPGLVGHRGISCWDFRLPVAPEQLTCCHCAVNVRRSVWVVALLGGCGRADFDLPQPSCVDEPALCLSGQTCWMTEDQSEFSCLTSGPGTRNAACTLTPGKPTCGDGLTCYAIQDASPPVCTPVCVPEDPAYPCPPGLECVNIASGAGEFFACDPNVVLSEP
jgi:hypothetical protein